MRGQGPRSRELKGVSVNESISLDLSPSELSFALSRLYRTKASKRQRLWWRCDAANRPPTRAPAGREPTDAHHSRRARARSHHGHRAATVTPQVHRLMFTEMEDQPRAGRRAKDKACVLFFRCCCHAARPLVLLAPFPILRASSP